MNVELGNQGDGGSVHPNGGAFNPSAVAELEMHIAAGTDIPTAFAAIGDEPEGRVSSVAYAVGFVAALLTVALWFYLG